MKKALVIGFHVVSVIFIITILDTITDHSVFSDDKKSIKSNYRTDSSTVRSSKYTCTWGGNSSYRYLNDGFCVTNDENRTIQIPLDRAPTPRGRHSSILLNNKLCIWGGYNGKKHLSNGSCYDLKTNRWFKIDSYYEDKTKVEGKSHQSITWTGKELCVWGGTSWNNEKKAISYHNTGECYSFKKRAWSKITTQNAPSPRYEHTAIWTGEKICIWGGWTGENNTPLNTGGCYSPESKTWETISLKGAPKKRYGHSAVWTGQDMCVWGGDNGTLLNTGGCYNISSKSWTLVSINGAPKARLYHKAYYKEDNMCLWGGFPASLKQIECYNLVTDTWHIR